MPPTEEELIELKHQSELRAARVAQLRKEDEKYDIKRILNAAQYVGKPPELTSAPRALPPGAKHDGKR